MICFSKASSNFSQSNPRQGLAISSKRESRRQKPDLRPHCPSTPVGPYPCQALGTHLWRTRAVCQFRQVVKEIGQFFAVEIASGRECETCGWKPWCCQQGFEAVARFFDHGNIKPLDVELRILDFNHFGFGREQFGRFVMKFGKLFRGA